MKYTDLIGRIKDNRKFTGSKEKGKGMGMEEMKKVKTGSIIVLVLSIITIVVMLIVMAAVGLVVSGMAGAAGASGAVIGGVMAAATVIALVMNGGIQFLFSLLILIKSKNQEKAGLCFGFGIVILIISGFWCLTSLTSFNFMTVVMAGEVIAAVFIIVNANKARKELAVQRGDSGTEDDGAEKMDN